MEEVVVLKDLTKKYSNGMGVFDLSFSVAEGELIGFAGTSGSGKTTIMRLLMGFIKETSGFAEIRGLNCQKDSTKIKKMVGYLPGEICFPDLKTATAFLKLQGELLENVDFEFANKLIEELKLDTSANPKKMSKGMKQKTAIVAALMGNRDVLILDEPTIGLDPLMRIKFLDILKREHKKGKTILITSNSYDELESLCDRVVLIKNGRILDIVDIKKLKNSEIIEYKLEFKTKKNFNKFKKENYEIVREQEEYNQFTVSIKKSDTTEFFKTLKFYDLKFLSEVKNSLEKHYRKVSKEGKDSVNK